MPKPLQLQLFGTPQISYLGQPLSGFVSGKVRALLIYLAVTARSQSRDHLAEFFWADTPASSRVNLRKALSNLQAGGGCSEWQRVDPARSATGVGGRD